MTISNSNQHTKETVENVLLNRPIHSLGQLTDMHLISTDTEHIQRTTDKGYYTIVYTPSNPDYYWGNFIVFSANYFPSIIDKTSNSANEKLAHCIEVFNKELGQLYKSDHHDLKHIAVTWDITDKELSEQNVIKDNVLFNGESISAVEVMTFAGEMPLPDIHLKKSYEFRPICLDNYEQTSSHEQVDSEWQQVIDSKIAVQVLSDDIDAQDYINIRYDFYRQQIEQGNGMWFGAFDTANAEQKGDQLIASFGLFTVEKNVQKNSNGDKRVVARFQDVDTHPDYRRQGICRNLIRYAINHFNQKYQDNITFCIMADSDSDAERVYQAVGFETTETLYSYEADK